MAEVGPLRDEKPTKPPVDEQKQAGTIAAGAGARLTVVRGRKTQQQGQSGLPADLDLRVVLTPVAWLWPSLNRWQQDHVVKAAKTELAQLRNVLEWPAQARSVLASRLTSRLEETGGEALVARPYAWITRRGLVRRPSCSDVRCDDGVRLDTGADCDNCANILHSRRAWRVRIAAEVDQELPGLGTDDRYREIEARMRRHAEAEAVDLVARQAEARERAERRAAARAEAEAQAAIERERAAAEAAARQAVACTDCGRERSSGLCEACDHRRQTEVLIGEAGLLAAAGSADLSDPASIAAAVAGARTTIGNSTAAAWQEFLQITDGGMLEADPEAARDAYAFTAFDTARQAVREFQDTALAALGRSEEAEAEARRAYRSEQRRPWFQRNPTGADAVAAATKAADAARERVAEYLLEARLEQLHERSAGDSRTPRYRAAKEPATLQTTHSVRSSKRRQRVRSSRPPPGTLTSPARAAGNGWNPYCLGHLPLTFLTKPGALPRRTPHSHHDLGGDMQIIGKWDKRNRRAAWAVGALTLATIALSTSPAAASGTYSGRAYVYGADGWSDDWNDEGILSTSTNTVSNATCLWQDILWADGLLSASQLDGVFGEETANATAVWQRERLGASSADGVVGKATFSKAGTYLEDANNDGKVDTYNGYQHYIYVSRDSDGDYHFYDGDGIGRVAGYDYRTCS